MPESREAELIERIQHLEAALERLQKLVESFYDAESDQIRCKMVTCSDNVSCGSLDVFESITDDEGNEQFPTRISLCVDENSRAEIQVWNQSDELSCLLYGADDGSGAMFFHDGILRTAVLAEEELASVELRDLENGDALRARLAAKPDRSGLYIWQPDGTYGASFEVSREQSMLELARESGEQKAVSLEHIYASGHSSANVFWKSGLAARLAAAEENGQASMYLWRASGVYAAGCWANEESAKIEIAQEAGSEKAVSLEHDYRSRVSRAVVWWREQMAAELSSGREDKTAQLALWTVGRDSSAVALIAGPGETSLAVSSRSSGQPGLVLLDSEQQRAIILNDYLGRLALVGFADSGGGKGWDVAD